MNLIARNEQLSICQLESCSAIPPLALSASWVSITKTPSELSIVCPSRIVPNEVTAEHGWIALEVEGPLPFSAVGVIAGLSAILASAAVSIFAVSTYDTDYLLIRERDRTRAIEALRDAGHRVLG
jgi:hypothetical protein